MCFNYYHELCGSYSPNMYITGFYLCKKKRLLFKNFSLTKKIKIFCLSSGVRKLQIGLVLNGVTQYHSTYTVCLMCLVSYGRHGLTWTSKLIIHIFSNFLYIFYSLQFFFWQNSLQFNNDISINQFKYYLLSSV